ncbi:AEC family transporter [Sulfurovum mangrovi]|uniref:AEC family transporter n=1 Tax=Sulfurovum mangrovi TaxID=2893889 RepID=UPI001E6095A5|nr:AEC family transporter [Sulfurovum mangrovi]UFH58377.1 AEC family transporter [Sulfurovum mangrovi]
MHEKIITSIVILTGVILSAILLRRVGLLKEEQGKLFADLVTHLTLPALVFSSLSHATLYPRYALLALFMVVAELLSLVLAWQVGKRLHLENPQMGAFMLTSAFGSSSFLGYALISEVFPGNSDTLAEAVIISEVGLAPVLFTVGTMVAIYYGKRNLDPKEKVVAALGFFKSPLFFSLLAGILWSIMNLPVEGLLLTPIFDFLNVLSSANTFLIAMTVGVLLHFSGMLEVIGIILFTVLIKLILKPLMLWVPTLAMDLQSWQIQVMILEAAMPSALLTVVFSRTYGCDAKLASKLTFATLLVSGITLITMFDLLTDG